MHFTYNTKNTCATEIDFDMEGDMVSNIRFTGGCNGNLKAIPRLTNGLTAGQIIDKLKGITCGRRPTSCADQLATAVMEAVSAAPGVDAPF